jgi:membrane protein DedA with SNARE-associated domain
LFTSYFLSLFVGTFILEDVALASSIALIAKGKIDFITGFLACFIGISLGDLGLYFIGYLGSRFNLMTRIKYFQKHKASIQQMQSSRFLSYMIVVSRFIPGTRLPTYLGAGFLRYSFFYFLVLTLVSVFAWVLVALSLGHSLTALLSQHWILNVLVFLFLLHLARTLLPRLIDTWDRKALFQTWRKWVSFEFWPAWFFYLPIVPYYIFLSLKHRSFLMPFYVNPHLRHGGLIGESKWDFLRYLRSDDPTTLKTIKLSQSLTLEETQEIICQNAMSFPFILKPDVGQRGFGVRIIHDDSELTEYLLLSRSDRILQQLSLLPLEAGLFYIRKPSEKNGLIFSITDKKFPFVVGDGKTKLGDLILQDTRARIIADVYFSRHRKDLNSIPQLNEKIQLSECGNHCQGAIFLNGENLISPALTEKLDQIAQQIPDFYFGRFDVRYQSRDSLMAGKNFEIVEVNGAGSEATHIWDASTALPVAYKTLFIQWSLLFEIGHQVKIDPRHHVEVKIFSFLKDCAQVFFRKDKLSISD